jgi:choline dehydrogenase-like flavoprotein
MSGADVVVIGSGPCGAMAATELVARGLNVTMLDAGRRPARGVIIRAASKTLFRWAEPKQLRTDRHRAVGDPSAEWYSSLTQGGLSNYWTSAVPRFAPQDFTDGAALDDRFAWPISYDDLVPFYERAEQALVVTSGSEFANVPSNVRRYKVRLPADWQDLCDRAAPLGHGMAAMPMANGRPWMIAPRSTGFNSYHCILKGLLQEPNFQLIRSATARRVGWNATAGRADAVEYVDTSSGEIKTLRADAVVVAAGSLDSTRILLRSVSADFPDGLGNVHGLLGHYLHDHPRQWWPVDVSRKLTALTHPVYISRAPYEASRPMSGASMTIGLANNGSERLRSMYGGTTGRFGVQVFGTIIPREDSTVSIDAKADADLDAPLMISTRYDETAESDMGTARDRFRQIFAELGIVAEPRGPFHELHPGSSVHYGGTVRMHASSELGMLDSWNRLHAVPNVVVCDASCFTTGPEKNPTLTAMAIAARAGHHLAEQLTSGLAREGS